MVTGAGPQTVTVLFTDLVDSTRILGELDARRAEVIRQAHVATLRATLTAHGGDEVKTLGDGIMAVFGSATTAISCAVAMQRVVRSRHPADEPALVIRIGVSSGDATEGEGDWHGPPVVEASRLCAAAEPGQTLVADVAAQLARGSRHRLTELGPFELKGIVEPVFVRELSVDAEDGAVLRVVLADDAVVIREGIARLLEAEGIEVVAQVGDALALVKASERLRPDVVIADIRMPPLHTAHGGTTAGIEAAEAILKRVDGIGVLMLSNVLKDRYARRLREASEVGIGYLSKDRVADMAEFVAAVRRVAAGGTAFDVALSRTTQSREGT
ncbi:MAG TPA: adenylate/guanylate cyclase domain-containing protein [Nocardioidaceae bacterium]|nr:adenylate/guanylate cyclase domain-containing protein [Nocardioidaceae bacterium]